MDRNPAETARPPAVNTRKSIPATAPEDVAKVITEARAHSAALGLYLWLVVITGQRRGELCGLQIRDIDLNQGIIHVAFNYVVKGGRKIRKDTKTHQDRWLAIDPDTCALIASYLKETRAALAAVGAQLPGPRTCSRTTQATPGRGTRTGYHTRSPPRPTPPESTSTSRAAATTPPVSSWPPDSTGATPPRALATAVAAQPHCGTTPTRYPRPTAEPPPICPASPQTPPRRPRPDGNSSETSPELRSKTEFNPS
jgi:hypothetical protein